MIPLERSFDLADANAEISRVIQTLSLRSEVSFVGQRVSAAKCRLYDSKGEVVAMGLGKGDQQSAITGALFEAVEHYFTKHYYVDVDHRPSSSLLEVSRGVLPDLIASVIHQSPERNIPCVLHECLWSGATFPYPLGLFMPAYLDTRCDEPSLNLNDTFDYARLSEYSSNTGVAIGMNRSEALVHGLLEAIERDTVSRFLVRAFLELEPGALRRVDPNTLPRDLRSLADAVSHVAAVPHVHVFRLENRFGIPTFCSWVDKAVFGIFQAGFGSSLSESHAIERSLYELAQSYLAFTALHEREGAERHNREILASHSNNKSFLRCATFDLGELEKRSGCRSVAYQGQEFDPRRDLAAYLDNILDRLRSAGAEAYAVDFKLPFNSSVTVTHTFVSDSDRFMTVLSGRNPMPSSLKRGSLQSVT